MCIRDRSKFDRCSLLRAVDATMPVAVDFSEEVAAILRENAVSYTHLTLPTSDLV